MFTRRSRFALPLGLAFILGSGLLQTPVRAQVHSDRTHLVEEPSFEDASLLANEQEALETRVATEQLIARFDTALAEGRRDDESRRTETSVVELVSAALLGSARLDSVECSSRLCRLDLTISDDEEPLIEALLEIVPDQAEAFAATRRISDGVRLLFYMSRSESGLSESLPEHSSRER